MKLKKIIIFYPSFERGGVEIILVNLINFFLKKKYYVSLISTGFNRNKFYNSNYFKLIKINKQKNNFFPDRLNKAINASKHLIEELKKSNSKNSIVFSLQSSSIAIPITKIFNFKIIVRNAEDPISSTVFADEKFFSILVFLLKFFFYNFADGIIANSKGSKNSLDKMLIKFPKKTYIYNPYIKKIIKNVKYKKTNSIISVGRLTKQKDFFTLIKAFKIASKKINKYKLLIIGDGKQKKDLIRFAQINEINRKVEFAGWVKNTDKYLKQSKLFVLSSLYEGLGNVAIDAVNYEIPLIVTNCRSGPSEIVSFGKGGYIVPIKNPEALASKIIYSINNYEYSKKKTKFAKKQIFRFICETNSKKYLNFIKSVFDER